MKTKTNHRRIKSDMVEIGAKLKARRKRLGISQDVVAGWIGISQRKASYFEKGRACLSLQQLEILNKKLTAAEKEGYDPAVLTMPLNLLSTDGFLKIIAETKESTVSDIWLFGPDNLAVFSEPALKESWASCVGRGATLHVVWRIDVKMKEYAMGLLSTVASRIIADLTDLKRTRRRSKIGSIHIYGIRGGTGGYEDNAESYHRDLQEHFKQDFFGGRVKVHNPVDISAKKFIEFHRLLDLGRFGTVLAYNAESKVPGIRVSPIAAGILIEHVSQKPHACADESYRGVLEIAESGWVFLAADEMRHLEYRCAEFQKLFQP